MVNGSSHLLSQNYCPLCFLLTDRNIHKIMESWIHADMEWIGLEGYLKTIYFQPIAIDRDIFSLDQVIQSLSNTDLNISRDDHYNSPG